MLLFGTHPHLVVAFSVVPSGFCQIENHLTTATNQSISLVLSVSLCGPDPEAFRIRVYSPPTGDCHFCQRPRATEIGKDRRRPRGAVRDGW